MPCQPYQWLPKLKYSSFNAPNEPYQLLVDFMNDATVLALTSQVVDVTIQIRKKYKTKLPDAIIAATALVYDLTLISRNADDFKNIAGLTTINPWEL